MDGLAKRGAAWSALSEDLFLIPALASASLANYSPNRFSPMAKGVNARPSPKKQAHCFAKKVQTPDIVYHIIF
jgi:hypothetical protein